MTYICVSVFQICFLTFALAGDIIKKNQLKCGKITTNLTIGEAIQTLDAMKQVYKCRKLK